MSSLPSLAPVEQKSNKLLHTICNEKECCVCSFKDADSLTPKVGVCDDRHGSGSETSNIISVCSSHDSSNENVDNKAIPRISDASEGMSVLSKVARTSQTVAEEKGLLESPLCCGKKIFSNHSEVQKLSDSNGEDTSCISRAESPSIPGDHVSEVDKKSASHSFGSVNSSFQGVKKTVGFQLAESNCQEKHCCSGEPTDFSQEATLFSGKSHPSEISSSGDEHASFKNVERHPPECSSKRVELHSSKIAASTPGGVFDSSESAELKSQGDESAPTTAKNKHLEQNANLSDELRHLEQSQTIGSNDKEDVLIDVNVCDTCGDAGREDLLAICSKCTDGAEHTYCMRVKLEKVPNDDWICEDCLLQEENKEHKNNAVGKVIKSPHESSSKITGNPDTKTRTCTDTRVANVGRNCRQKSGLVSRICGKRRMGSLTGNSFKKRKLIETSIGPSRMTGPKKDLLPGDSPPKDLDNAKIKPTSRLPSFDDHSLNKNQMDIASLKTSVTKSPPRRQVSQGILTKSKTFNISDWKGKAGVPGEGPPEKQETNLDKAFCDKGEQNNIRRLNKSLSLNNASSGRAAPANEEVDILPSKIPHCKDSITTAKHVMEQTSSPRKIKSKQELNRAVGGSCTSIPRFEKETAPDGATSHAKPVQTCGNQSVNKPKFVCNDQAGSDVGNKLDPFLSKVIQNLSDLTSARTPHERKENTAVGIDHSRSSTSLLAGNQFNNSCLGGKDLSRKSQGTINQSMKAQRTSYLSSAGNRSLYSQKSDSFSKAQDMFPVNSPETVAVNRVSSEEAKQKTDKDCKAKSDQIATSGVLAIPKFDYIWKGGFKINSVGKHPSFCWGIQAHLSTRSSPKIPEVVRKLPSAIPLEEVSRTSVWPTQFLENCPNEECIGVYFFAEDVVSYKGRYGNVMERMINDDLALKGDVDGLDLLIFSSNLLPQKSQCWNKLYFLWGIFRGRRIQNGASKSLGIQGSSRLNDPQVLPSVSHGRSHVDHLHQPPSCKGSGDYSQTNLDVQGPSRLSNPRDKSCTLAPPNEIGFPSSKLEVFASSNSSKAQSTNVAEDQCQLNGATKAKEALFELNDVPSDENAAEMLPVPSHCSTRAETEVLDLGLSLGTGKISGKPGPAADGKDSRSGGSIPSVSVELSLGLPSYNA